MPYKDNSGNVRYTLKEKYQYHKNIANSGKKNGSTISFTERNNHAEAANRCQRKLGKFMNGVQRYSGFTKK